MASMGSIRLTGPEQPLMQAVCFCAVSMAYDDRLNMLVDRMRVMLGKCPPRPETMKLRMAAQSICDSFARRNQPGGAADWMLAGMKADAVAQDHHWAGFCATAGA